MPSRLIRILETKASNQHEITIQQIQTIISKYDQEMEADLFLIRTSKQKIAVLKAEPNRKMNDEAISTYQYQIINLLSRSREATKDLFILHSYFVQVFLEFVFSQLDHQAPPIDPILVNRLKELESKKSRDPLHVDQVHVKNEFNANEYTGPHEKTSNPDTGY